LFEPSRQLYIPCIPASRPLLVAHSYFLRYDEKQRRKGKPYAPLATLGAAALARARGFEVKFFDAMLAPGVEAFEQQLDDVRPAVVAILEDNFNFLTKMCTLRMRRAAFDMITAARARGCRVAINGSDASDHPDAYLSAGADAVILNEAEGGFLDLVEVWSRDLDGDLTSVSGLALPDPSGHRNGKVPVIRTPGRRRIEDLDSLPFPAWDLVDVEQYREMWTHSHGRLSWGMVTSRGCPYGCNWCAKPIFGRRYAQRSPANVAAELALLRAHVRPDHIWFADDIFGLTPEWIDAFAHEVTRRGARTPFMMQSRANLMTPAAVAALRRAGAEEVWLGVESGSQKILDAMEKGSTLDEVRSATRALKAQGIRACWFIQLGYLGESREDLEMTRALILEEHPDEIGVSVAYPLPGTPFHETVRSQLNGRANWEETDSLEMLFHGTYTTEFYRMVRDVLHAEVDSYRAGGSGLDGRWQDLWAREAAHRNPSAIG
jgi:anaerobic magnesium-protoporphyrin IX monomethyl ester cyclase